MKARAAALDPFQSNKIWLDEKKKRREKGCLLTE